MSCCALAPRCCMMRKRQHGAASGLASFDVKSTVIESADAQGRIRYVHPDCEFWILESESPGNGAFTTTSLVAGEGSQRCNAPTRA